MTANDARKTPAQLAADIVAALHAGASVSDALQQVLASLNLRAIGLWRVVDSELQQCGYVASSDMAPSVASEFRAATRIVPLSAGTLAIVRSVLDKRPIAARDDDGPQLAGSASWLRRFGARQSLSCPVVRSADSKMDRNENSANVAAKAGEFPQPAPEVIAAFAAAAELPFAPESPLWKSLIELAAELGRNWPSDR